MINKRLLSNGTIAVIFLFAIAGLVYSGPWTVKQAATIDAFNVAYSTLNRLEDKHSQIGSAKQPEHSLFEKFVLTITHHKPTGQNSQFGDLVKINRSINFGDFNNYAVYSKTGNLVSQEGKARLALTGSAELENIRERVVQSGEPEMVHSSQASGFQVRTLFIPLIKSGSLEGVAQVEVVSRSTEILVSKTLQAALWISCFYIATLLIGLFAAYNRSLRSKLKAEEHAHFLSKFDRLTSLYNRKSFEEEVHLAENGIEHAMLLIDVDNFKTFNDRYGHLAGDAVLDHVSSCLKTVFSEAKLCRWAGDEFIVFTNSVSNNIVFQRRIDDLQKSIATAFEHEGVKLNCSISIGAYNGKWNGDLNDFIHKADAALYVAKSKSGKGQASFYTPKIDADQKRIAKVLRALETALDKNAMHLVYQPQFDAIASKLKGFEALLRWEDEVLGNISPAEFIPIAEDSGLIIDIGNWVLREACKRAIAWPNDIRISVNVSAVQFEHPDFLTVLKQAVYHSGLDPKRLEIELTETALLDCSVEVQETVKAISAMGVSIAMDDFGTGHSTLTYLATLPVSKIKIDRSFVSKVGDKGRNDAIINAIVGLAQRMDISIIAEGVETSEQKDLIVDMGCSDIQGFLYGRPLKDPFAEETSVQSLVESAQKVFGAA